MSKLNEKLFLHTCCAPCAEWPIYLLSGEGFQTTLFFYNPNIHPKFEWDRRLQTLHKLGDIKGVPVISDTAFEQEKWTNEKWIKKYESRCEMCYDLRMSNTAREAKERGFDSFSTTLLVSIYQNHDAIIEAANRASQRFSIPFHYVDFRDGFRKGQQMAREDGLYRQKYCGCICSLDESEYKEKIYAGFPGSPG